MNAPLTIASNTAASPIVIIGSGLAGWTTVRELRKLDKTTPIEMFTADNGDFYAKPSLSNALSDQRSPDQLVTTPAAKMAEAQNVTLHAHTRVHSIDTAAKTISTDAGVTAYGRLVLATGAQQIKLPLQGNAVDEVLSVNSLADFAVFHERLLGSPEASPKHVLIMGAGLIGCEFANDLAATGHRVSVVDLSPRPLAALLPVEASEQLQAALSGLGVHWHLGTSVQSIDRAGDALQVKLANGHTVQADLVLSAVGLRADTALAQAAGVACERGVLADALLQTNVADVYSVGDGTAYASAQGRTLPYVMPIMQAARTLASVLAGAPKPLVFPLMPVGIKTPIYPLVVALPAPGTTGDWVRAEEGVWQFKDGDVQRGFVLSGAQTKRRAEQSGLTQV
jgi:rubredoxin-NAD+ reductase